MKSDAELRIRAMELAVEAMGKPFTYDALFELAKRIYEFLTNS